MKKQKELIDMETGEILNEKPELNVVKTVTRKRADGTLRIQQDFTNCPTMTEQHTAHLTNINYLMERYKPDELAAYIAARNEYRREIVGHDFSREPDIQDAKNIIYQSKQEFEKLPDDVKSSFRNHVEFLKFIDNPDNAEKMLKMGILTKREIEKIKIPDDQASPATEEKK